MMKRVSFALEDFPSNCEDYLSGGRVGAKRFRFEGN